MTLPLVFPPMAMGFLLLMFLGRNGWGGLLLWKTLGVRLVFSEGGIILAAWLAGLPLVVKPVQTALGHPELLRLRLPGRPRLRGRTRLLFFPRHRAPYSAQRAGAGCCRLPAPWVGGRGEQLGGNIAGRTNTLSLERAVSTRLVRRAAAPCWPWSACCSIWAWIGVSAGPSEGLAARQAQRPRAGRP